MKKYLIIFFINCVSIQATAQQGQLINIVEKLNDYHKRHLVEKLYVHTDRESYLAGETLWFKVYAVDGFEHHSLDLSRVVYLEILNQDNEPVLQVKAAMEAGTGNGSIFIPVTINSGNYTFRAYTSWMQNSDPGFFFEKEINIINTFKTLGPATVKSKNPVQPEFYPEGGYLVEGLPGNLVIKIDENQLPLTGSLIKNGRDTLQSFEFNSHGLAKISFVPSMKSSYQVMVSDSNGKQFANRQLPVAREGYTLQAKIQEDQVIIDVHSNMNVPLVNLLIHNRQKVTHAEILNLQNGKGTITIDKKDLRAFISHITIFDMAGNPVAERLFYKPGNKNMSVSLTGMKKSYPQREKVSFQLHTSNENDEPVVANLSMAVRQVFDFEKDTFTDISQYIQLHSDLPTINIEMKNTDAETMDLLLLTAGWRRFSWEEVLRDAPDTIRHQPELNGHIVKGKIVHRQSQELAPYVRGYLSIPGKKAQIFGGLSNAGGNIYFETRDFYQKNQIVVQTENDSLYQITIENPFSEKYLKKQPTDIAIDETNAAELNQRSINLQVQNTYYGNAFRQSIRPDLDSIAFYGQPDATYYLDDYTRFPTMEDVMREYVANVWVRKNREGYYYLVYDLVNKDVFKNSSLVLLDGIPIFDTDKIIDYDPLNVQKIELVKRKFLHGLLTCDGIVSYTTYEGNLKDFPLDPRTLIIDYEGLQAKREFYAPEYGQQKHNPMPDFRSLLHWQPEIITNEGNAEVSFYTSDQPGTYQVDIQGMTPDGRFGSQQLTIEVKSQVN